MFIACILSHSSFIPKQSWVYIHNETGTNHRSKTKKYPSYIITNTWDIFIYMNSEKERIYEPSRYDSRKETKRISRQKIDLKFEFSASYILLFSKREQNYGSTVIRILQNSKEYDSKFIKIW